ncbi:FIST signal transduction protein [Flammeovirga agarivorans]|uniref:FIST C domain-containing protein n=1 Tax=Flammeovirga agarivorans TaxID=2726742 RepID=A0A7X8SI91_9BACT|nr:FIST N-terminal domain-containing protein [Flammeovirga agarivorans]NLR90763.1 hypothetical protein [Flammeovirga agarivorans]
MYFSTSDIDIIVETIKKDHQENEVYLFLIADASEEIIPSLIEACNSASISCMGAIFPILIAENQFYEEGLIAFKFNSSSSPMIINNDSPFDINYINKSDNNAFLFIDGLSLQVQEMIEDIYQYLGANFSYFGGGAGSLSLVQKPCVFTNQGLMKDSAIFCTTSDNFNLGIQHGWSRIHGPLIATKTEKNKIVELNWQNAFELYQEFIRENNQLEINEENFLEIAKSYPFGMMKEGQEDIVRDPYLVDKNGALNCVGEVLENSVLYILNSTQEHLIKAAEQATKDATLQLNEDNSIQPIVMDCISRYLFLGENYPQEINVCKKILREKQLNDNIIGALSMGEISSYGNGQYIEFFNKTIVINAIDQPK